MESAGTLPATRAVIDKTPPFPSHARIQDCGNRPPHHASVSLASSGQPARSATRRTASMSLIWPQCFSSPSSGSWKTMHWPIGVLTAYLVELCGEAVPLGSFSSSLSHIEPFLQTVTAHQPIRTLLSRCYPRARVPVCNIVCRSHLRKHRLAALVNASLFSVHQTSLAYLPSLTDTAR
jgi:hypothetical protein